MVRYMKPTETLASVIGEQLRALRERYGKRQDEIAGEARQLGFRWTRATVAAIEAGNRRLSIEEFLFLPYILGGSLMTNEAELRDKARKIELPDLFTEDRWIALATDTFIHSEMIREIVRGRGWQAPDRLDTPARRKRKEKRKTLLANSRPETYAETISWQEVWPDAQLTFQERLKVDLASYRDAEQKAARKLKVPPLAVSIASYRLWEHGLTEERDQRVAEQVKNSSSRTLQAIRGHITRALLGEIEPFIMRLRGKNFN